MKIPRSTEEAQGLARVWAGAMHKGDPSRERAGTEAMSTVWWAPRGDMGTCLSPLGALPSRDPSPARPGWEAQGRGRGPQTLRDCLLLVAPSTFPSQSLRDSLLPSSVRPKLFLLLTKHGSAHCGSSPAPLGQLLGFQITPQLCAQEPDPFFCHLFSTCGT